MLKTVEGTKWDVEGIGVALGTSPNPTSDKSYGEGLKFIVPENSLLGGTVLELYPDRQVLRLRNQAMGIVLIGASRVAVLGYDEEKVVVADSGESQSSCLLLIQPQKGVINLNSRQHIMRDPGYRKFLEDLLATLH